MTMLTHLTPDLAVADTDLRFPGGVRLPIRMTVARLPDGGVVLVSPLAIDDAMQGEIEALGPVRYLVGPNLYHHLHLRSAHERFPAAALIGAPGLAAKRKNLTFAHELGQGAPPWGAGLDPILVRGAPKMNEVVLYHAASRTLITTDLVFNVVHPPNWRASLVLRMMGTRGRLARSRLWKRLIVDRAAFDASIDQILALHPDRLIMAHGEVVNSEADPKLAALFARA